MDQQENNKKGSIPSTKAMDTFLYIKAIESLEPTLGVSHLKFCRTVDLYPDIMPNIVIPQDGHYRYFWNLHVSFVKYDNRYTCIIPAIINGYNSPNTSESYDYDIDSIVQILKEYIDNIKPHSE